MIRVLIADDQRVVRDGLAMLVGLLDGVEVIGTAQDGEEAVVFVERERPDVVLMDLNMPHLDGTAATRRIRESGGPTQVLVLTTYADDASLFPALEAGALGYLTKDADAAEIERAITAVAAGDTYLEPAIQRRLVEAVAGRPMPAVQAADPAEAPDGLTPREVDVLRLIAEGLSNTEIAERLYVSTATVKTHVNHIFQKTGARDRAQAVGYAYRHRLAEQPHE
ncbi:MAG: response regulator [Gaiellaceae bacterium]